MKTSVAALLTTVSIASLAACGGGGGGGGAGVSAPVASTIIGAHLLPIPERYADMSSGAFRYSLGELDAIASYASIGVAYTLDAGFAGEGVLVAIVDTGIDLDNAEFSGAIHPASISVITDSRAGLDDTLGHGTAMAGIIGARANGEGLLGVAPSADLLAINAHSPSVDGYDNGDLAVAIDYAVSTGADIINLSLGGGDFDQSFFDAVQRATYNDVMVFKATGNDGRYVKPDVETTLIGSDSYGKTIVAVTAVDANNELAYFAQPCDIYDPFYCLAAPGVDILVLRNDGGYEYQSGTSHATAIVSGSAAVLKQYFPTLTGEQIVEIMLLSADDLGAPGVDRVYGSGLVNLERALMPIGTKTVAQTGQVINEETVTYVATSAPMSSAGLVQKFAALEFHDGYNRKYLANFGAGVRENDNASVFEDFFDDSYFEYTHHFGDSKWQGQVHLGDYNRDRGLIFNPYGEWVNFDGGFGVAHDAGLSAIIQLGMGEGDQPAYAQLAHEFDLGATTLSLGVSYLHERGQVLGARYSGAFGNVETARTMALHGAIAHDFGALSAYGYAQIGKTETDYTSGGLIQDIDDLSTASWGVGVEKAGLITVRDMVRFGISQPLRVFDGDYVLFDDQRSSLEPNGHETRVELGYQLDITDNIAIESTLFYRNQPDHVRDADGELALDFGVSMRF